MSGSPDNIAEEPVCSICIANYNGETLLRDCLDSILSQEVTFPYEVIVHDDASTDSSLALLRERYPTVKVLQSTVNVGFCISNNRMAEHARGDYLLLFNNDAALFPGALSTLFEHARHQPLPAILTLPQYDWKSGELVDRGCLLDLFYNPVPNRDPRRQDVAMVIGACLWIPRQLWLELGGFPEWMGSIAEDMYLCCLARLRGFPVQVTLGSGYRHWQGRSFSGDRSNSTKPSSTYRRRALSERNKTFIMFLFSPVGLLLFFFLFHMAVLFLEGLVVSLLTHNKNLLRKVYLPIPRLIWQNFGFLFQLRGKIQQQRVTTQKIFLSIFKWFPWKLKLLYRLGFPEVR